MVLIYRRESWIVTEAMIKVVELFHHWRDQRIAEKSSRKFGEEGWEWSSVVEALGKEKMWPMKEYTCRRKATIAEYIANHPI